MNIITGHLKKSLISIILFLLLFTSFSSCQLSPAAALTPTVSATSTVTQKAQTTPSIEPTVLLGTSTTPSIEPTDLPEASATSSIEPTDLPKPIGSPENPLILGIVQVSADPQAETGVKDVTDRLTQISNLSFQGRFFPSYMEMLTAMDRSEVQIAFLPPLTYLWSYHNGFAIVGLLANHFGTYMYASQFLANTESQFNPFFDPDTNKNTADATAALPQFAGKRPCWVDPTSLSGFILPSSLFFEQNINLLPMVFAQSSSAVIRALYIKGICDFGATYAMTGDPRTASAVQQDLPDALERIEIIWRSDPIIPNLNISYLVDLPDETRQKLNQAFLELIKDQNGKDALTRASNYEINDLKIIDNSVYDPLRKIIDLMQIDLITTIGR